MAKFSRFDARNKRKGKHKSQSINKETRIRYIEENSRFNKPKLLKEVVHDNEFDYDEPHQLNG